jgi:hypothetical protein
MGALKPCRLGVGCGTMSSSCLEVYLSGTARRAGRGSSLRTRASATSDCFDRQEWERWGDSCQKGRLVEALLRWPVHAHRVTGGSPPPDPSDSVSADPATASARVGLPAPRCSGHAAPNVGPLPRPPGLRRSGSYSVPFASAIGNRSRAPLRGSKSLLGARTRSPAFGPFVRFGPGALTRVKLESRQRGHVLVQIHQGRRRTTGFRCLPVPSVHASSSSMSSTSQSLTARIRDRLFGV